MSRLSSLHRRAAEVSHYYHGDEDGVTIRRLGSTDDVATDAVLYNEKVEWRRDSNSRSGDRHRIYTRRIVLLPGVDDVPVGSLITDGTVAYTVESAKHSSGSGCQILVGVRDAVDQSSRPGSWE